MELKYVVPNMEKTFGMLEFAGEKEVLQERDNAGRRVVTMRSYNLYSDVQRGENIVVELPATAGEKRFKPEQQVKLLNPKLIARGYAIGNQGHTNYVLQADDMLPAESK